MDLDTPLEAVAGIGQQRARTFASKGLVTVEDLLYYMPFRYEDRSQRQAHRRTSTRARPQPSSARSVDSDRVVSPPNQSAVYGVFELRVYAMTPG